MTCVQPSLAGLFSDRVEVYRGLTSWATFTQSLQDCIALLSALSNRTVAGLSPALINSFLEVLCDPLPVMSPGIVLRHGSHCVSAYRFAQVLA